MCVEAKIAFEVASGRIDHSVQRQVYDLVALDGLIQSRSSSGDTDLVFVLRKSKLSDIEFTRHITLIIGKLKTKGYILKRVQHPNTEIFILDISWKLGEKK